MNKFYDLVKKGDLVEFRCGRLILDNSGFINEISTSRIAGALGVVTSCEPIKTSSNVDDYLMVYCFETKETTKETLENLKVLHDEER